MNKFIKYLCLQFIVAFSFVYAQDIQEGILCLKTERYGEARNIFEKLLKDGVPEAYYYLDKLNCLDSTNLEKYYLTAIEKDKEYKFPLNYVGLGTVSLLQKDTSLAIKYFEQAIDIADMENLTVVLEIADAYIHTGSKAYYYPLQLLNKAKENKEWKKNSELYSKLGDIYFEMNNGTAAINNYQISINYDNNFIHPYIKIGILYSRIKNYSDAENYFKEALRIDTTYSITYKELAEFYNNIKQYELACQMYKKYLDYSEVTIDKNVRYTVLLYLGKKYDEAVEIIKTLELSNSLTEQLQHILAFSYYSLDDFNNGIPAFEKYFSISNNKISSTDYEYYGKLLSVAGKDSAAVESFKKAIQLDSSKCDLRGDIAASYFKMKKWSEASNEYKLKENCNGKFTFREYFDYGRALMLQKRFMDADSVFIKIVNLKPDFPLGYLMRARANSSIDTTSELGLAKPYYQKFIELAQPSDNSNKYKNDLIEAYSYLGYYYFLVKDSREYKDSWMENYKANWQKILELDPNHIQAKEALKNTR